MSSYYHNEFQQLAKTASDEEVAFSIQNATETPGCSDSGTEQEQEDFWRTAYWDLEFRLNA